MGYYIYKYRHHIRLSQRAAAVICVLSMAASFGITLGITEVSGEHFEGALTYASPFVAISAVTFFLFVLRIRKSHFHPTENVKKIVDLFCGCSFGIYLIHILFLDNYKKYVEPQDLSAFIAVPALTIGIALVSLLCVWGMRKTKIGRKIT